MTLQHCSGAYLQGSQYIHYLGYTYYHKFISFELHAFHVLKLKIDVFMLGLVKGVLVSKTVPWQVHIVGLSKALDANRCRKYHSVLC